MKFRQLGQYRLHQLLGRGGMGRVYKACRSDESRLVALKLLAPLDGLRLLMSKSELRRRFLSEAGILTTIQHPNVVDVIESGLAPDGSPFYTMAFFGHHLGEIIGDTESPDHPSRILPLNATAEYMNQLFDGLKSLHCAGMVHRDIKPANLLITSDNILKICDFGLVKHAIGNPAMPRGLKVGSPWYAAPEQEMAPDRVDHRADIYSAGVVCYRLLFGQHPESEIPVGPHHLVSLQQFLKTALNPKPELRYPDIDTMAAAFHTAVREIETAHQQECATLGWETVQPTESTNSGHIIRSTCRKVSRNQASDQFSVDHLSRPISTLPPDRFRIENASFVYDPGFRLCWQRDGSPNPMTLKNARAYVRELNRNRLGGHARWRLPTVSELLTLISTPHDGRLTCSAPVFDSLQKWVWSCDRQSFRKAWYVSVELGYASCVDMDSENYVRAVSHFDAIPPTDGDK